MAVKNKRNPDSTKTGKKKIFGMTVPQLNALLENEGKKKVKAKIKNRIEFLKRNTGYVEPVAEVTEVTEVTE